MSASLYWPSRNAEGMITLKKSNIRDNSFEIVGIEAVGPAPGQSETRHSERIYAKNDDI
jgi:hypothetical protein